jgi:hypothetical protein
MFKKVQKKRTQRFREEEDQNNKAVVESTKLEDSLQKRYLEDHSEEKIADNNKKN